MTSIHFTEDIDNLDPSTNFKIWLHMFCMGNLDKDLKSNDNFRNSY